MRGIDEVKEIKSMMADMDETHKQQVELEANIRHVKQLREEEASHEAAYNAKHAEFNQANALLIERWQKSKADLVDAEARLRELTLKAYQRTDNKKPATGVSIKLVKTLKYDPKEAKAWAVKENPAFLQLDAAGFEAWAKIQIKQVQTLPIAVEQVARPRAEIAKEL